MTNITARGLTSLSDIPIDVSKTILAYSVYFKLLKKYKMIIHLNDTDNQIVKYNAVHFNPTVESPPELRITKQDFYCMLEKDICRPSKCDCTILVYMNPKSASDWIPTASVRCLIELQCETSSKIFKLRI